MFTPIQQGSPTDKTHLSKGEVRIVRVLSKTEVGLSYAEIKRNPITNLSDTAMSAFVKRLQRYNYILKDEHGKYHLTRLGFLELAHRKVRPIGADELRMRHRKDFTILWNEAYRLHERILHMIWHLGADKTSRQLMKASGGEPGLILVGAIKSKDGRQFFKFQTLGPEELERLGYVYDKPNAKAPS